VKTRMLETEGRCPLHVGIGRAMPHRGVKSLVCDKVVYTFPFRIYYCHLHGYWVWRGKKGHQLVNFSKLKHQATKVEPLPPESPDTSTIADYLIVKMKCPYCEHKWEQYDKTQLTQSGGVFCPDCGAEIPKEKALVKRDT
jgi:hypothetical protein